jgi:hypothetical protein
MNSIVDNMEALLADAHKAKGWHWVSLEPMWTSWPMEKFGASIHTASSPPVWKYNAAFASHLNF